MPTKPPFSFFQWPKPGTAERQSLVRQTLMAALLLALLPFACHPPGSEFKTGGQMDRNVSPRVTSGAYLGQDAGDMLPAPEPMPVPEDRETYAVIDDNPVRRVSVDPVSTFSIDVDTGSYSNVRRFLNEGRLPPTNAVRIEELVNYFSYDYPIPEDRSRPFAVATEIVPTPWNSGTHLLRIGVRAYEVTGVARPAANLVFLVDVSGSMIEELTKLKGALKVLTNQLTDKDRVAMVAYAGAAGEVLGVTPGSDRNKILAALDSLEAGGSTNGGAGIQLAYALARKGFIEDGINRILLATDGDMNVGTTGFDALLDMAKRQRETGISLTTLGFGSGNYNDQLLEQLADAGNGNHAYIDTLKEAQKVLADQINATLFTVAKDVKIQVEFNPANVAEYRLIGYENRILREEDFKNDKVDAGEIGAGHRVTALYEITLANSESRRLEPRRYGGEAATTDKTPDLAGELAFIKMRYKLPGETKSVPAEFPVGIDTVLTDFDQASQETRFASAVAAFGQLLRGGRHTGEFGWEAVEAIAKAALGKDPHGYRGEFVGLVRLAGAITPGS